MKIVLLTGVILAAGCASPRPYQNKDTTTTTANPSSYTRDTSDCEREAALAGAGEKNKAFESCMKARNRAPKR